MATIITIHMPRKDAVALSHDCPGIHSIDIVHPPGIDIPSIEDMDAHLTSVTAALTTKASAEMPKKLRSATIRREIFSAPLA